jgi:hypothetical protein
MTSLVVAAVALALLPFLSGTAAVPDEPTPEPTPDPGSVNPDPGSVNPVVAPVPPEPVVVPSATTFEHILADLESKQAAADAANAELAASTRVAVAALRALDHQVFRIEGDGSVVVYGLDLNDAIVRTRPAPPTTPVPAA